MTSAIESHSVKYPAAFVVYCLVSIVGVLRIYWHISFGSMLKR